MAAPSSQKEQLMQELGRYLVLHHGHQQALPLDVGSFPRRIQRRCGKDPLWLGEQHQAYPALCAASPEALVGAVQQLAELQCAKVERLTAGPKTLTMLTWVGEAELARLVGGGKGPAGNVESVMKAAPATATAAATAAAASLVDQASGASEEVLPYRKKPRTEAFTIAAGEAVQPTAQPQQPKETVADILGKPTALEAFAAERFKKHAPVVREFCQHRTKAECEAYRRVASSSSGGGSGGLSAARCAKLHFKRVMESHTDVSLGDCAYLSTCRRTRTCKFIHYVIEDESEAPTDATEAAERPGASAAIAAVPTTATTAASQLLHPAPAQGPPVPKIPAQWVNTDVRDFDLSILGQFAVIMADPPWEVRTLSRVN